MDRDATSAYYWATESDPVKLAGLIHGRVKDYWEQARESGLVTMWRSALANYYGQDPDGRYPRSQTVTYGGRRGEQTFVKANHFGSLAQHILVMTTSQRPAFECAAVNSDPESLAQTIVAEGVLDYYLSEEGVEEELIRTAELGILAGRGWIEATWDVDAGEAVAAGEPQIDPATGEPMGEPRTITAGDLQVRALEPWDVACDLLTPVKEHRWRIVTDRTASRWDLIAGLQGMDPDGSLELAVRNAPTPASEEAAQRGLWAEDASARDSDLVILRHFWHAKTPAMPMGRYVRVCGDAILFDGPLPYEGMPQIDLTPSTEIGASRGYARMWDTMGLQVCLDGVMSAMQTMHDAFGVSNIVTTKQAGLTVEDLADGMRLLTVNNPGDKPELLQLLDIPEESFKMVEAIVGTMEQLSGVNSVSRGDPPASLKSGSALALVQSMALQYNSGLQRAYVRAIERLGTSMLRILQTYAQEPRLLEIAGSDERSMLTQFAGSSIASVRRVKVNVGNPVMRTNAGRMEIADTLMQLPPEERDTYLSVVDTGRLPARYQHERALQMLLRAENESLAKGQPTPVIKADKHDLHVEEHLALFANPDVRRNDDLAEVILDHIQQHIVLKMQLVTMEPDLAMMTGNMPAGMPMGPPPGAPPPNGAPPDGGIGPEVAPGAPQDEIDALPANMPQMPEPPIEA